MANINAQFIPSSPCLLAVRKRQRPEIELFLLYLSPTIVCVCIWPQKLFVSWVSPITSLFDSTHTLPFLLSTYYHVRTTVCLSVVGSVCHVGTYVSIIQLSSRSSRANRSSMARSHIWHSLLNHHCPKIAGQLIFPSVAVNPITHSPVQLQLLQLIQITGNVF